MEGIKFRFRIELDGKLVKKSKRIPTDCYDNRVEWIKQYYYFLGYDVGEVRL